MSMRWSARRSAVAVVLVALMALVPVMAAVTPDPEPATKDTSTQAQMAQATVHGQAWANLLVAAQDLSGLAERRGEDLRTSAQADQRLAGTGITVTSHEQSTSGDRLCLSGPEGEYLFFDARVDAQVQVVMGLGECKSSQGLIIFHQSGEIEGEALLTQVRHWLPVTHYGYVPRLPREATGPSVDEALREATETTGDRLVAGLVEQGTLVRTLTTGVLSDLGVRLPKGVRVGFYLARETGGPLVFTLCLSDGDEFAWYEAYRQMGQVTMTGRGGCLPIA